MHKPRCAIPLMFGLMLAGLTPASAQSVPAPPPAKIGKPRPAPPGPSTLPPLPPAVIDNALAIGGNDVAAKRASTRLTVDVRVNGSGPYRFIVDSGADTSVVGLRIATALRLPVSTPTLLNAVTARNIVDRVKVEELSLGQSSIRDLHLPALSEQDMGGDGIVGIDALVNQRLMMDFEKLVIKVEDARQPAQFVAGEIVVVARRHRGQLILTEVNAGPVSLDAIIDTGTEVSIGNLALRDKLIRKGRGKFFTVATTGVTGVTVDLEMALIDELQLGPITLRNVPIAFADVPPFAVFGVAKEPALLLGTDILETFRRVSLDFRSRKVRFQLKRCESTGIALSTSPIGGRTRVGSNSSEACQR